MKTLQERNCPVCKSTERQNVFSQNFENVLGIESNEFHQNSYACKKCGMIYVSPYLSDSEIERYYAYMSNYEYSANQYDFLDIDKNKAERQFQYIDQYAKENSLKSVFDIGASVGFTLNLFKKNGYEVSGLEPSSKCREVAKSNFEIDLIGGFIHKEFELDQKFDVIILSHVIEHLLHPREVVSVIRNLMSDDGILFVEQPDIDLFDERDLYQFSFEHVNYFNIGSLENLMGQVGMTLLDQKVFENSPEIAPKYPTLGTLWTKGEVVSDVTNNLHTNQKVIKNYLDLVTGFRVDVAEKIDHIKSKHKNISIWGAGTLTSQIFSQTSLNNEDVEYIFDNDPKKGGNEMNGIKILHPSNVKIEDITDAIIIGSYSNQDDIYNDIEHLIDKGVSLYKLF